MTISNDLIIHNTETTTFHTFITEFKQAWIAYIFIKNPIRNLIIPATINNYPVVAVADNCLQFNNEEMLNNIKCITLDISNILLGG